MSWLIIVIVIIIVVVWYWNMDDAPPKGAWGDNNYKLAIDGKNLIMTKFGVTTSWMIVSTKKLGPMYKINLYGGPANETAHIVIRMTGPHLVVIGVHMDKFLPVLPQ